MNRVSAALLVILVALGITFLVTRERPAPCPDGCNVLLIMVDTLGAEHLETYGYMRDTMPKTTEFFSRHGIIFENASTNAPWTLPSFTGLYFSELAPRITYAELDAGTRPSLQSALRDAGVALHAVRIPREVFIFDAITRLFAPDEILVPPKELEALAFGAEHFRAAADASDRFFFLMHTFEAHDPYAPGAPYNALYETTERFPSVTPEHLGSENATSTPDPEHHRIFRLRYDQQLTRTDDNLAAFLEAIPDAVLQDTVIILSADHGTSFGEHGRVRHGNNGLFEEEIHVPLMMRIPGVSPMRIADNVSHLDMAPTILSLMSVPIPETFTGTSLVPRIRGNELPERVIPFVTGFPYFRPSATAPAAPTLAATGAVGTDNRIIDPNAYGVRIGDQKLMEIISPDVVAGMHWYDLSEDPGETRNLFTTEDALPTELTDALKALKASL